MTCMDLISDEIILYIISYLKYRDIMSIGCVNKRLSKISKDTSLRRAASFNNNKDVNGKIFVKYVANIRSTLSIINIEHCYWFSSSMIKRALEKCHHLVQVRLLGCNVTLKCLESILNNNPMIEILSWSISKEWYRQPSFNKLQKHFNKLHTLIVRKMGYLEDLQPLYRFQMKLHELMIYSTDFEPLLCIRTVDSSQRFNIPNFIDVDNLVISIQNIISEHHISTFYTSFHLFGTRMVKYQSGCFATDQAKYLTQLGYDQNGLNSSALVRKLSEQRNALTYIACSYNREISNILCMTNDLKSFRINKAAYVLDNVDLDVIASIAQYCQYLRSLCIYHVHYHVGRSNGNELLKIISGITTLEYLSISDCAFSAQELQRLKLQLLREPCLFSKARTSYITSDIESCSTNVTGSSNNQHCDDTKTTCSSHSLLHCSRIKEFEVIGDGHDGLCTFALTNTDFLVLSTWRHLRKIKLRQFWLVGSINFLSLVAKNCSNLQSLSLGLVNQKLGSFSYWTSLITIIPQFRNLQVFEFEEPDFCITQPFLKSLTTCKELHTLSVLAIRGKIEKNADFIELFENCKNLTTMCIHSAFSSQTRNKRICKDLRQRYHSSRPTLLVEIVADLNTLHRDELVVSNLLNKRNCSNVAEFKSR